MITKSIQFRDEINDRLVESANKMHVSVNWLVNQLCDEGLDRLIPELKVTVER
jgi:predicted transcriptional regulator